mgnify:FL=1
MKTKIIGKDDLNTAAALIAAGQLVAVPTETVYGLACSGLDADAVEQVYEVKGRPEVKPLSLMLHKGAAVTRYCANVPKQARVLMDKFWPGPLTIVLKSKDIVPDIVRAGGDTVALRCPDHADNAEKSAPAVCRALGKSLGREKSRYGAGGARILRRQNCRRRGRRKMRPRKRVNYNRYERGTV